MPYCVAIGVAKPGNTRAVARASPIIATASASYLDFQELLNQAHN